MNRRDLLLSMGAAAMTPELTASARAADQKQVLPLEQFQPRSMLHTQETRVPRSAFPVIDMHTHITHAGGLEGPGEIRFAASAEECLTVMDRKNIRTMVNLTSGYGANLQQAIDKLQTAYPERFIVFTEPAWSRAADADYSKVQADLIADAHQRGAKGLKILKILGLYLRENVTTGTLVRIDDPRFDAMWEAAGSFNMPVAIHSSDPEAFFLPVDRFNERWEELNAHPDWSFYGRDFPTNRELQEARRNVMRRHPRTQFVCLHVADSEDLQYVSECLDTHPNMHVEMAARIGELGRQPRAAYQFIERYQDRVMFGTDAVPGGKDTPQQVFNDRLYEIYYRFLETNDEYFDYAPAPIPPQGRWRIYGLGLPEPILRKIYLENAARLLNLSA
ncbi:MAG: amidohydrolase family protein [Acidobacteriaceae bacterium]|nr:amidohydrolase family protein [Acidobacteriaceae bacterium]